MIKLKISFPVHRLSLQNRSYKFHKICFTGFVVDIAITVVIKICRMQSLLTYNVHDFLYQKIKPSLSRQDNFFFQQIPMLPENTFIHSIPYHLCYKQYQTHQVRTLSIPLYNLVLLGLF